MHVLHDATENQQHLRELLGELICPSSWISDIQNCLLQKQSFQIQLMVAIVFLRWSPTNTFHIGEFSSSSSYMKMMSIQLVNTSSTKSGCHDCE